MKRIRFFEIIGVIVIFSLTVFSGISCAKASDADKLEGVTWVLKSYGDPNSLKAAVPDRETTLKFDKETKRVGGNGGVNSYGGDYKVDGDKLTVSNIVSTKIAGPEPVQSQENAFFRILQSAQSFKINGQELTITGTEGVLVFTQ
jgi:heat shock protein HslJ